MKYVLIYHSCGKSLLELPVALSKYFKTKTIKVALMGGIIDANTLLAEMLKDRIMSTGNLKSLNLLVQHWMER
jgi:hypothetical protein